MKLATGLKSAKRVVEILSPYCDRIEIAGSIRREKMTVKDIEVVAIPKQEKKDLFSTEFGPVSGFIHAVNKWVKVKGEPTGKYTQRILPNGAILDLFIVTKDNWGVQFAIRTGSAEFSKNILAKGWVAKGYHSEGGILRNYKGETVEIPEEEDLFKLIEVNYILPKHRN